MRRPVLLGVILKAIGIWMVVFGIAALPAGFRFLEQYQDEQAFLLMMADSFASQGVFIVAGLILVFVTDRLISKVYPGADLSESNAAEDPRSRELLDVLLKSFGVWCVVTGIAELPPQYARSLRYMAGGTLESLLDTVSQPGLTIISGLFLIFATDWFVRVAYRRNSAILDGDEQESVSSP